MSQKTFELKHEGGSRYCVMEYEGAHLNRKVRGSLGRNDARAMANEMRHAYEDGYRDGYKQAQSDGVWLVSWSDDNNQIDSLSIYTQVFFLEGKAREFYETRPVRTRHISHITKEDTE